MWDPRTGVELHALLGHTHMVLGCAVSPDGAWIVSASEDRTLKVWYASSGDELLTIPLLSGASSVTLHPWKPLVVCGDSGGGIHLLDLIGVEYGSIIVTPATENESLAVRCPACQREHSISQEQLGGELTCLTTGCGVQLKINPFVIHKA